MAIRDKDGGLQEDPSIRFGDGSAVGSVPDPDEDDLDDLDGLILGLVLPSK